MKCLLLSHHLLLHGELIPQVRIYRQKCMQIILLLPINVVKLDIFAGQDIQTFSQLIYQLTCIKVFVQNQCVQYFCHDFIRGTNLHPLKFWLKGKEQGLKEYLSKSILGNGGALLLIFQKTVVVFVKLCKTIKFKKFPYI